MTNIFATFVVVSTLLPVIPSQHQDHSFHDSVRRQTGTKAHIVIEVNPEVRVNVRRGGKRVPDVATDGSVVLDIEIVNDGFLTAALEARLVDSVPCGVELEFLPHPLQGVSHERRTLRIVLKNTEPVDVTIAFHTQNAGREKGGRDRLHFYLGQPAVQSPVSVNRM